MEAIETYRGVAYPWHMDHMGHMNVQFYAARFDEATWHLLAALGLTPAYLKNNRRGMVAAEQHTQFRKELLAGALIRIASELIEVGPKTVRFVHRMYDVESGEEVASTEFVGVHIDSETRRSIAFAPEILARVEARAAS